MQGLTFAGDRKVKFITVDDPAPGPMEVVIEVKASGMCGSDLMFYRAPGNFSRASVGLPESPPVIGGHEPCGVVVAVGPGVDERLVGRRMMIFHYTGCGWCRHCRTGWAQMCDEGPIVYGVTGGHGAHAPYMKVPVATLVPLADELSFEAGAAISCGTGTAFGALKRLNLVATDTIAIFGQGPVGLSATQLAVAMGARVIALDIDAERLRRAGEFGAFATLDASRGDALAAIKELAQGGADLALETSGAGAARSLSVKCLKKWGAACFVGEGGTATLDVSPDLNRKQVTVMGSFTFSIAGHADCAKFVLQHKIDVDALFTDRWRLDQADEAYRLFDTQTRGKGVFLM
jgi:D-arabinose 1-dehydrogenase-like Zn-dependent alcohol dehydrogenase